MTVSDRYRTSWEGFWEQSSGEQGEPFWDSDPALTARRDLEHLAPYADPTLPVADLGCGNGTQTRFLSGRFTAAVGVDLSAAAVAHARRADPGGAATYEQLNLADPAQTGALHERLGDTNVYMRAVLHQSDPEDRPAVAAAVALLVGTHGKALILEPTGQAKAVIAAIAARPGGPSPRLRRVMENDLRPGEVAEGEVAALLRAAGLTVLDEGATALAMSDTGPDGSPVELPARWFVVGRL
ncbi:class I SAM-dependent methyltransferase [Streptomyces sp. NBC_00102]|uniref:class I SAM-dependent methyltransferase n=1 Tax=Streptomyces sp. NBC_00102 TaxID=2975652 RepID=UPI00224EA0A4|nr:class I SAM-dependent methyltransferase [Streptomyces sp. NBC_00102]MCX5401206.1 class I SAM-dependent methyltransferase [Streptomyces sp. NBC_00102]